MIIAICLFTFVLGGNNNCHLYIKYLVQKFICFATTTVVQSKLHHFLYGYSLDYLLR